MTKLTKEFSQTSVQRLPIGPKNRNCCSEVPQSYASSKRDLKMVGVVAKWLLFRDFH